MYALYPLPLTFIPPIRQNDAIALACVDLGDRWSETPLREIIDPRESAGEMDTMEK